MATDTPRYTQLHCHKEEDGLGPMQILLLLLEKIKEKCHYTLIELTQAWIAPITTAGHVEYHLKKKQQ